MIYNAAFGWIGTGAKGKIERRAETGMRKRG